jgi:PAB-dependent poly(A)-specific ribonuclease subunit 2
MKSLWCMSFTSKGTQEILVAGLQDLMFVVDCSKGEIIKQVGSLSLPGRRHVCR